MKEIGLAIVIALLSSGIPAQPVAPPTSTDGWCVTGSAKTEELRERHEFRERMSIRTRAEEGKRVIEQNGLFIVETDDSILVNDSPLDLVGSTLRITPEGDGYRVARTALAYRGDVGPLLVDFSTANASDKLIVLPFSFSYFGSDRDRLWVTNRNGVHFERPALQVLNQYEAFDLVSIEEPVVSPLLLASFPRTFVPPRVYVRSSEDELIVTWRTDSKDFAYDVQTVLSADGSIDLSWRSVRDVEWGAAVVTPGLDAANLTRQFLLDLDDVLYDDLLDRPDLDLAKVEIERLDGTDIVEIRIRLRGLVSQNQIAEGEYVQYGIDSSASSSRRIVIHLTQEGTWILLPGRGWISDPGSLELDGSTIRFLVRDRDLQPGSAVGLSAWVWDSESASTVDSAYGSFDLTWSNDRFESDLSAIGTMVTTRPIIESFTLPDMDPYAVWELLQREYDLDPVETDAVAIYQSFFTDLVLYAGAYSTVGNPAVDGISHREGHGTAGPRFPALLHMSKLGYRYNTTDELSIHVLTHEFGHRWLYFFEISENGERTHSLNPAGGHPAQFVHTPAAFDVLGSRNSSAMGGSWFEDLGGGTFRARNPLASYGFSWHELYLMGLADPAEVEPWFYIANSDPKLGDAYYPPDGIVVSGTRRDVTVHQIIDAMGPRIPDADRSRKRFVTYFVLLVRDLDNLSQDEVDDLDHRRRLLQYAIPAATGGRASVSTLHGDAGPRRRGIRRP